MVRVVRPGGVVVIAEADYHAYVIDSPAVDIAQQLVARHAKALRNPDIGRRVRRLCHEAGAAEVRMRPELRLVYDLGYANAILLLRELLAAAVVEGALPGKRAAAWWAGLEELDRAGRFLLGLPFFVAIARVGS